MISNNSLSDRGVPVIITNSIMGNCTITDPPSQCVSSSTLQILNTRAVDSGEYTCVANTVAGKDEVIATLIVNGMYTISIVTVPIILCMHMCTCIHACL